MDTTPATKARYIATPRGILRGTPLSENVTYSRHLPSEALVQVVQHYWMSEWDLQGRPAHTFEVLGHPNVQLHFGQGSSQIIGVHTHKITRTLCGVGRVFGIKFRAAAFYPLLKRPLHTITNKIVPLSDVLPDVDVAACEARILSEETPALKVAAAEAFLLSLAIPRDPLAHIMSELVDTLMQSHHLTQVNEVAELTGLGVRRLQRLFAQYVGASPKWVVQRYRMHEALSQLQESPQLDMQQLVHALGYHDQSHFIRDFKAAVGQTPAVYSQVR